MVEGFKHTEIGLIPNDWEVKSLREVADINQNEGKSIPDEFVYIDLESVTKGRLVKKNIINKASAPSRAKRIVFVNDILFQTVRPYQKNNLYFKESGEYVASTGYAVIRCKIDPGYIYAQLHTDRFVNTVVDLCTGTSYPAINPNVLASIKIPLPPTRAEQTAIATALNDADALIQKLEQLIAKKRLIKQAAMQELLKPKEGWEVKKLGELAEIEKGEQLNRETLSNKDTYPVYNGGILPSGYTNKFNTNANSIIISEGGNSCGFVNFIREKFWRGGHCYLVKTKQNLEFFFHLLKFLEKEIMGLRVGSGLPNIQRQRLLNFEIYSPNNKSEQTRIAQILSDMHSEIVALEKQLAKYKLLKKGMMQMLLTGKIRLVNATQSLPNKEPINHNEV